MKARDAARRRDATPPFGRRVDAGGNRGRGRSPPVTTGGLPRARAAVRDGRGAWTGWLWPREPGVGSRRSQRLHPATSKKPEPAYLPANRPSRRRTRQYATAGVTFSPLMMRSASFCASGRLMLQLSGR